jgi:hypothetical protein
VDEVVVRDHTAEIIEGVGHAIHLEIVVTHREVTLVAECGIKMKHTRLVAADELVLKREPDWRAATPRSLVIFRSLPMIVPKIQERMTLSICSHVGALTGRASERMWSARS